jgi:hypothetical protein
LRTSAFRPVGRSRSHGGSWLSVARSILIALVLTATAFQSYIAQTHVHGFSAAGARHRHVSQVTYSSLKSSFELQSRPALPADDHTVCLLCQAVAHTGAALVSTAPQFARLPPTAGILTLPRAQLCASLFPEYGSRQRGPPLA